MATKAHCLSLSKTKLPDSVIKEVTKSGGTAALTAHIDALQDEQKAIMAATEAAQKALAVEAIKATPAYAYTHRNNDPTNKLNQFKPSRFDVIKKNLVQRLGSITNVIKSLTTNNHGLNEHDQNVLNEFNKTNGFNQQFNKVFESIYKTTDNLYFRYTDLIQYFPQLDNKNGSKFDDFFKSTISSAAFEWLHTESKLALGQTDDTLKRMFGLSKDETVPDAMKTMLMDLGVNRDILADQLGRVAYDRLNIEAIKQGDQVAKVADVPKLIRSLGYMAIATMENMTYSDGKPIVKRQELYNKAVDALKAGDPLTNPDDIFYDPTDIQRALDNDPNNTENVGKKDKGTRKFIKLNTDRLNIYGLGRHDIHSDLADAKALLQDAPDAFTKVFGDTPTIKSVSWVPIKISNAIGKFGKANKRQTKNLQKSVDVKYVRNVPTLSAFQALTGKALDIAIGMQEMDGKLDLREKNVEGVNRGLQRDLDAIKEQLAAEEAQNVLEGTPGKVRPFYINARFQAQHRMLQTGFNGQASKLVRNLFSPESFNIEFNPATDTTTDEAFLQSIALAFGIETIKVGGKDNQLDLLPKKLANEKIANAIKVLQKFYAMPETNRTMTDEQQMTVAIGVQETGSKLHGLKGLVEYARYDSYKNDSNPNKGLFTTDMYDENDGVSNGVIFAALMFIPDSAIDTPEKAQDLLAIAAMGGVSVDRRADTPNLDKLIAQKNLNDAYQRMGQIWASTEQQMKLNFLVASTDQSLSKMERDEALTLYNQFMAIESLLGRFTESVNGDGKVVNDGVVNKLIRNLSKPRTMQTVYRAGIKTQNKILAMENVIEDGIYASLEKLIQRTESITESEVQLVAPDGHIYTEISNLLETVKALTSNHTKLNMNHYMTDGWLDPTKLKAFKLNTEQINDIVDATRLTYGEAMSKAIDSVYSHIINASKPFVALMERAASTYNFILKAKVDAAIKEKDKLLLAEHETKKEMFEQQKKRISQNAAANKRKTTLEERQQIRQLDSSILALAQEKGQLTIEELKVITDSIERLIPKIKTPVHTDTDPSYLYLAKLGSMHDNSEFDDNTYDENALIEQAYEGKTPRNKGYVTTIPYLANIGASGFVKSVQMMDAMHANHVMGIEGVDLLSIHDGFVHGIKDSKAIADSINQYFKDTLFGSDNKTAYSIGAALIDMHNEMTKDNSLMNMLLENNISIDELVDYYAKNNLTRDYLDTNFIGVPDKKDSKSRLAFLKHVHEQIDLRADSMAKQVTRNKQILGDAVTHVAQYPHNGTGVDAVSKSIDATVFGVNRDDVLSIADAKSKRMTDESVRIYNETGISGSSAIDVSTDPADYTDQNNHIPDVNQINSQNVADVFNTIVNLDEQASAASVPMSEAHKSDLKRILTDIVSHVMKPVEFYMSYHKPSNDETAGAYTPSTNGIWIQRQQPGQPSSGMLGQGIRMSAAEVYAHELIHSITYFGLRTNALLMTQSYDLYEFARDSLEATYGNNAFKVFLNEALTTDAELTAYLNDAANAHEITAAKARWKHLFNNKQRPDGTHDGVDEFLAFGMTNENFKREMATLAISQELLKKRKNLKTIFEKNIQQTIVNIYTMVMDFIQHTFKQQQHSLMVGKEIENLVTTLAKSDAKSKNVIFSVATTMEARATAFGLDMDEKVKTVTNKAMNKFALGRVITTLKELPELDNMLSHKMRVAMLWYKDQQQGFPQALVNEIKGTTEHNRKLHDLLARRNLIIDMAKQEINKIMSAVNRAWFTRKLDSIEKTALTKVLLKGDISLLHDYSSFDAIKGFIESPTKRDAHINVLLGEVRKLIYSQIKSPSQRQEYMTFFEGATNDLGHYMITSEEFLESYSYKNAHNLVMMDGTKHSGVLAKTSVFEDLVKLADQLASTASIRHMTIRDRQAVVSLMNENPEAVKNVMLNHRLLQEQAANALFDGSRALMEKGYVKTILNSRIQFELGTLADERAFADRGYTKSYFPLKRETGVDPVIDDIYIYTAPNGTNNDYQSGIFSTTRNKTKGANAFDFQIQLGNDTSAGLMANVNNKLALAAIKRKADYMLTSTVRTKAPLGQSVMTPSFNTKGKMSTMRYVMTEHTKDTVLQQFSEFDSVLGSMAGQIVDKQNTPTINAEVVVALREMWDKEKTKYPEAYVKIGPHSTIKHYRDLYENLPLATKQHILSEWGENGMWVAQDVVDLVFGQRKYSITEMFGKTPMERNLFERVTIDGLTFALGFANPFIKNQLDSAKGRAVTRAKTIEDFLTQATKLAKGNIIIRNFLVTWGNHLSNMMYLKSKGIPLNMIMKLQREAITSALQYQADNDKLQTLVVKRNILERDPSINAATKVAAMDTYGRQIKRLEYMLSLNPSTAMIKAGLLPSIVDDVNTEINPSPHKFGLDKIIDTGLSKLHPRLEKAGRVVFMTEDTEGYKMLNNAVKMTDYVGRYVLYKHYTAKGMEHKEAVSKVADEFINFAPPTHRMLEYANSVGLVWFSKYQLRVLKHIKNLVVEHPFSTLATLIVSSATHGNNIMNSIPFVTKDMSMFLGNPLSALSGSIDQILPIHALDTITGG